MRIRLFLTACLMWVAVTLYATHNTLTFSPIPAETPLPTGEVRKLCQDQTGYIWIATYSGLARYDGYSFLFYKTNPLTGEQLMSSSVNLVAEDADHTLWIGTHTGLFAMDEQTEQITKIHCPVLETARIEAILPTETGDIWVATSKGLFMREKGQTEFQYCTGSEWNLLPCDMKALAEDASGTLWIGTWADGLIRYDVSKREAYRYSHVPCLKSVHSLCIDSKNRLWIGTWGAGLVRILNPYDNNHTCLVQYQHSHYDNSLLDDIVYCMAEEPRTGELWIGSRSGLSVLNLQETETPVYQTTNTQAFTYSILPTKQQLFTNYAPSSATHPLPSPEINSILFARDGSILLASYGGGVFQALGHNMRGIETDALLCVRERFGTASVRAIYQDAGITYLSITGFGLVLYDRQSKHCSYFTEHEPLSSYNVLKEVHCIARHQDVLYFGTGYGILLYTPQTKAVKWLSEGFSDPSITHFDIDPSGRLWITTRQEIGYLNEQQAFVPLKKMPIADYYEICFASARDCWAISRDQGVFHIQMEDSDCQIYPYNLVNGKLPVEGALALAVLRNNEVMIGTENGLYRYNTQDDCFCPLEQLPHDLVVSNLHEDRKQRLWMTTSRGLMMMDGAQLNILTSRDGLLHDFCPRGAAFQNADGTMLLGCSEGISILQQQALWQRQETVEVAITDITISDISVRSMNAKESPTRGQSLNNLNELTLRHNQNHFSIHFTALDYQNSLANTYTYRLIGYDKTVKFTDTHHRLASYNNLPRGTYVFEVQASNCHGTTTQPLRLTIHILPQPWLTWWAILLYSLAVVGLIVFISITLHRHNSTRKQLEIAAVQQSKSEEVNHIKLQFFTNITHELLTPLSIILAAVEEIKPSISARSYEMIEQNATRLTRLIQQIIDFRKTESQNLRLKVAHGNLAAYCRMATMAFEPLAKKKGLNIYFESPLPQDLHGYFDSDKVDKILYNLISNATKYNEVGGSITVSLTTDIESRNAIIKVKDTGSGIPQEEQKQIFSRFYDGDYRKHNTTGNGIGLNLTMSLVELHHGQLFLDSKVGEGSTFTVILPITFDAFTAREFDNYDLSDSLTKEPELPSDTVFAVPDEEEPQPEVADKPSLLLVEDNADLLELFEHTLSKTYTIYTAASADAALPILCQHTDINLVISDIMMPGMTGYEFCQYIKQTIEISHIPVVLLTAKQTSADKIVGYQVGADAYLTKPVEMKVVEAVVSNILERTQRMHIDYQHQLVFDAPQLHYTSVDEQFVGQAVAVVNKHLSDSDFTLQQFVNAMNTSKSTLSSKLKHLTGLTPSAFVNNIRVKAAYQMLLDNKESKVRISELAFAVGFNDPKYFSALFKRQFGCTPQEFKQSLLSH